MGDVNDLTGLPDDPDDVAAPDDALRADVRLVTSMLGEALVRSEGQDLLDLVEKVRAHAKSDTLDDLPETDLATSARLAHAFTAYFHLANVTEQVHRGRALLRAQEADGGWLERTFRRIGESEDGPERLVDVLGQVGVRPVFTAHPTEVQRRSTLDKMRHVAALLDQPPSARRDRRLREAIDLLWLTDEIRVEPPE